MTANTTDEQRMEAAVQSVTAKLERFQEGLSPEERFTLGAAFWKARAEAHTAEIERLIAEQEDVQGHLVPLIIGLTVAGAAGAWAGATIMNALLDDAATVGCAPTLDLPLLQEPIRGPGGAPV